MFQSPPDTSHWQAFVERHSEALHDPSHSHTSEQTPLLSKPRSSESRINEETPLLLTSTNSRSLDNAQVDLHQMWRHLKSLENEVLQLKPLQSRVVNLEMKVTELEKELKILNPDRESESSNAGEEGLGHTVGDDFDSLVVNMIQTDNDAEFLRKSEEYRNIVKNASQEFELACDVWGATTLVIVKDLPDLAMGEYGIETVLRIAMVFVCLALNLLLQLGLLYWISRCVLVPSVSAIQDSYKTFHGSAFESGQFVQQHFDSLGDQRREICEMAITVDDFLGLCLFLWFSKCFNELRSIYRRLRAIRLLPDLPKGVAPSHITHEVQVELGGYFKDAKCMVVCTDLKTRFLLYALIFVPRVFIAMVLLVFGTAFLTATASFADLILNSLSLSFVLDIDELIMTCFLPARIAHNLGKTKIMPPKASDLLHMSGPEFERAEVLRIYKRSITVLCTVICSLFAWFWIQPVIPHFEFDVNQHCVGYLSKSAQIDCKPWDMNCFPKGV